MRLLTPGDNPGGYTALSAHYAVVLPASPVIRRQISLLGMLDLNQRHCG